MSSELDTGHLNDDGEHNDEKEERVIKEVLEYVDFIGFQFSGIDFVENLKQDKCIEEDAIMFSAFDSPFSDSDGGLNTENFGA